MAASDPQPPGPLKIAAAQYPLHPVASMAAWQEKLRGWVSDGAATGADILLFPEYAALELAATSGPEIAGDLSQSLDHVASLAGPRTECFVSLAREFGVHIVTPSGPVQTDDGRFVNAAQLITPDGLVGEQHKLMMTPFERNWGISAGTDLNVFRTRLATFAITICYDVEFPLIARRAALLGADCLLVPSCTDRLSGYHRVRTGALARALENSIAAVQSPTVGDAHWSPAIDLNVGAAGIYMPTEHGVSDTGILVQGDLNVPTWLYGEVDLARLRQVRETGEMRNFQDWDAQPGANGGPTASDVIDLTAP